MFTQSLKNRKAERDQGHDREQGRIDKTHGAQRELAEYDVAAETINVPENDSSKASKWSAFFQVIAPNQFL